jgi:LPS-assembly protein
VPPVSSRLALLCLCLLPLGLRAQPAVCPQLDMEYDLSLISPDPQAVLTADDVSLEQDGISKLRGNVRLSQDGKEFLAEDLDYDDDARRIRVNGELIYRSRELVIRSQGSDFDLGAQSGRFDQARYTLPSRAARGSAETVTISRDDGARLERVDYTTCAPGSSAWLLQAQRVHLDHESGLGTARHARIRFGGVPILYIPYFQFPIDDRRRTGLLFPTMGESDRTGFDVRWPVYLNLGPNYDATFTPRQMSKRGLQLNNDFRYLLGSAEGNAHYEYLDRDQVTETQRSYFSALHQGLVNRRLSLEARYAEASDNRYFEDLGGNVDLAAITHLERSARLVYQAPAAYRLQALVQDYQTIASNVAPVDEPYRRLPQLRASALTRNPWLGTRAGLEAEYVNFVRKDSIGGQRVNLKPYLRYEYDRAAAYVSAEADYRYTGYQLSNGLPGEERQPERQLPSLSAETGLRFERVTRRGGLQTLEPKMLYLYVPFEDQSTLPLFDSGEPDFDFTQLFARNRFAGEDRISDANHVAMAATSRLLDPETGLARWSASVGQIYRFHTPRVELPGFAIPDRGATEFIASLDYRLSRRWLGSFSTQWSPDSNQFQRVASTLRYRGSRTRMDLAYRYREALLEQADAAVSFPLFGGYRVASRVRYSLDDHRSLDTYSGLEYETCCWAVRASYRRYIANTAGEYDSGAYLQLELKGLTRIGNTLSGLLPLQASEGAAP